MAFVFIVFSCRNTAGTGNTRMVPARPKTINTTPNTMRQFGQRSYHLLLITALFFGCLATFIIDSGQQLDLHLHDTYFIVAHNHIVMLLALIALLMWILYVLINRFLYSRTLIWIHVVMSILSLATIALWQLQPWHSGSHPSLRYMEIEGYKTYTGFVGLLLLLVLAAQLVLPIIPAGRPGQTFQKRISRRQKLALSSYLP